MIDGYENMNPSFIYKSGFTERKTRDKRMALAILIPYSVLLIITLWGSVNIITKKVPVGFDALFILGWLFVINFVFLLVMYMLYPNDIFLYQDYLAIKYLQGLLTKKISYAQITIQFMLRGKANDTALVIIQDRRKKIFINGNIHSDESIKYIFDILKSKGITSEIRQVNKFLDFYTDPQYKLEVILSSDIPKWD